MHSSSVSLMIVVIGVLTFSQMDLVHSRELTLFGQDISGNYLTTSKHKYGIPFATRTAEVAYPDDFSTNKVSGLFTNQVVRGIKHYNDVKDPECNPKLEITKGGINQQFATLSITSKKGCQIDSTVGFITEKI